MFDPVRKLDILVTLRVSQPARFKLRLVWLPAFLNMEYILLTRLVFQRDRSKFCSLLVSSNMPFMEVTLAAFHPVIPVMLVKLLVLKNKKSIFVTLVVVKRSSP